MILTTLPDLPPRPETAANAAFRRRFYVRWGHENAIVCGYGRPGPSPSSSVRACTPNWWPSARAACRRRWTARPAGRGVRAVDDRGAGHPAPALGGEPDGRWRSSLNRLQVNVPLDDSLFRRPP
jgi:hypothetical protein